MTDLKEQAEHVEIEEQKRNRILVWIAACVFILGTLGLASAGGYAWHLGRSANNALCQSALSNRQVLRRILSVAEMQSLENAETQTDVQLLRERFARLRAVVPPAHCEGGVLVEDDSIGGS